MEMLLESCGYVVNAICMIIILQDMYNIDGNSTNLNIFNKGLIQNMDIWAYLKV